VAVRCNVKVGIVFSANKVFVILQETGRFCNTFCVLFCSRRAPREITVVGFASLRIKNADSYGRGGLSSCDAWS